MHFAYFDETKFSKDNPFFSIGGIILKDSQIQKAESILTQIQYNFFSTRTLTRNTELHGSEIFQGKGAFKGRTIEERLKIFKDITHFLIEHKIPVRIVTINVKAHREKHFDAQPEYSLGLMLILERICDYLEEVDDIGMVFGDYEQDEITKSVLDFSQFKTSGKTPMYHGRPLGRLIDTIYFTHSHHSRFLQIADMILYLANRYQKPEFIPVKWPDRKLLPVWDELKNLESVRIQRWP